MKLFIRSQFPQQKQGCISTFTKIITPRNRFESKFLIPNYKHTQESQYQIPVFNLWYFLIANDSFDILVNSKCLLSYQYLHPQSQILLHQQNQETTSQSKNRSRDLTYIPSHYRDLIRIRVIFSQKLFVVSLISGISQLFVNLGAKMVSLFFSFFFSFFFLQIQAIV